MLLLTEGDFILQDIIAAPDDDSLRLIYADWLEDNGQLQRAKAIRYALFVDRANKGKAGFSDPVEPAYWVEEHNEWLRKGILCGSDRGFVCLVDCDLQLWRYWGKDICAKNPIRKLKITCHRDRGIDCWWDSTQATGNACNDLPMGVYKYLTLGIKQSHHRTYKTTTESYLDRDEAYLKWAKQKD